jgi:hypothetical protein
MRHLLRDDHFVCFSVRLILPMGTLVRNRFGLIIYQVVRFSYLHNLYNMHFLFFCLDSGASIRKAHHSKGDSEYALDIGRILNGDETRTTVMVSLIKLYRCLR